MRRIRYSSLALVVLAIGLLASAVALAGDGRTCPGFTPPGYNGFQISTRVFNDCPTSILTVTNGFPNSVIISDNILDCFGFANLHTWSFSTDGGLTKAQFENCSHYEFAATVMLDGSANGEGGLRLAPWWSPDADGKFMLNVGTGEIACFGGRLPFYSFTVNFGLHYLRGLPARMDIVYNPHFLSQLSPATITYNLQYNNVAYTSGELPFDQGNPAEDPPHGLWGELVPAYCGGYFQPQLGQGVPVGLTATFSDIFYNGVDATPTTKSTWGKVKTLYR